VEIYLLIGLPVIMGTGVFLFRLHERTQKTILVATAMVHCFMTMSLWFRPCGILFNTFMGIDAPSQLVLTVVSVLFCIISVYMCGSLTNERMHAHSVCVGSLLFFLAAMTLVTFSRHMGLLWIAIEATTLLSVPLINYYHSTESIEATWKYLLISSLGIAMALLGTFFLAIATSQVTTIFLDDILLNAQLLSVPWLKLSIIFLVVGYGTKMGLAPMHTWKPDVYGEAPPPIGALLAGVLTSCAFLAFFRIAQICMHAHIGDIFSPVFILMGILSIAIAAIFIMGQKDFSRLLGYSSIEHMGIIVLGLGLGGQAVWASFYHVINNSFVKGLIFLAAGNVYRIYKTKKVADIQGSIHSLPVSSVFLLVGFIAVTGFPPFGIFYSEILIFKQALVTHHYVVAFLYFLFLTVIFFGFSRILLQMVFGEAPESVMPPVKENMFFVLPLVLITVILFVIGIILPSSLSQIIAQSSLLLGGN